MIRIDTPPTVHPAQPQHGRSAGHDTRFAELLAEQSAAQRAETPEEPDRQPASPVDEPLQSEQTDSREELIRLLSMSPAERIRYTFLREMGLTEESLSALPYEQRMRIEEMIEQEIKRQLGTTAGEQTESRGYPV